MATTEAAPQVQNSQEVLRVLQTSDLFRHICGAQYQKNHRDETDCQAAIQAVIDAE